MSLDLSKKTLFPFSNPVIKIELKDVSEYVSMFDIRMASFEDIMREHWHPSIKLGDIIEKTSLFIENNLIPVDQVPGKVLKKVHKIILNSSNPLPKIVLTVFFIHFLVNQISLILNTKTDQIQ